MIGFTSLCLILWFFPLVVLLSHFAAISTCLDLSMWLVTTSNRNMSVGLFKLSVVMLLQSSFFFVDTLIISLSNLQWFSQMINLNERATDECIIQCKVHMYFVSNVCDLEDTIKLYSMCFYLQCPLNLSMLSYYK